MKPTRLEAFSDGVIAIIITIMVLDLKPPHEHTLAGLAGVLPTLLSYVLSFLLAAIYWVNHHHLIHLAQKVDAKILWANINLLFWMSLIPWVTACLGENCAAPLAVGLYAIVASACSASFFLLRASIACHHRQDQKLRELHRRMGRKNLVAQAFYAVAVASAWVCVPLSVACIVLPPLMYFLPDRAVEKLEEN